MTEEKSPFEELLEEIQGAVKNAVSLKITTIVGNVKKSDLASDPVVTNSKTMYTQLDLIQGDIVSMVDEAFLADEFASIREHHNQREDQAHEIISKNIEALKELGEFVKDLLESGEE